MYIRFIIKEDEQTKSQESTFIVSANEIPHKFNFFDDAAKCISVQDPQ